MFQKRNIALDGNILFIFKYQLNMQLDKLLSYSSASGICGNKKDKN